MVKLVLADDHKLIREGITALLAEDDSIQVVGEAACGSELLDLLANTAADVVMLDLSMPGMDGFEAMKQLRKLHPDIEVLVLSMLDDERYVHQMLMAGAAGYLLKSAGKQEMVSAINLVAAGLQYISSSLTLKLLHLSQHGVLDRREKSRKEYKELSKREVEVLQLISEGHTNAEISEMLFTSKRTIETHRQNLLEKTQTKNTAALVKFAVINDIIT